MAPPSLKSWLRTFIRHEVDKTLDWKRNGDSTTTAQSISADNGRQIFSDDGSNFRSFVTRLEDGKDQVQILEVLSTQTEFAEVRVSDGQTKVRARLSKDIISRWEHDAGEEFCPETKGDVIQLKKLVVVSTSFGPSEGFVWLDIQDIEYCYHLRKLCGQPVAVDQDRHLKLLIDDIAELRKDELTIGDSSNATSSSHPEAQGSRLQHGCPDPIKIEVEESSSAEAAKTTDSSQSAIAATQHEVRVPATEHVSLGTQKSTPKKRQPRLEQDGFEVQQGVNLAAPTVARAEVSSTRGHNERPSMISTKPAALLGLLSRKRGIDDTVKAHEPQSGATDLDRISETPVRPAKIRETSISKTPTSITRSPGRLDSRERRSPSSAQRLPRMTFINESSSNSGSNVIETQQPHIIAPSPVASLRRENVREASPLAREDASLIPQLTSPRSQLNATAPTSNQVEHKQASGKPDKQIIASPRSVRKRQSRSYENGLASGRRNIPSNQKKLLDSRSSWFPSLPGQTFPIPNVPIELLSKWSRPPQRAISPEPVPQRFPRVASPHPAATTAEKARESYTNDKDEVLPDVDLEETHSASEPDEEDEEELPSSDWPASPPQPRKHLLPPNSSPPIGIDYNNPIQSSAGDNLAISPPRPLPVRTSPKKPINVLDQNPAKESPQRPTPDPSHIIPQSPNHSSLPHQPQPIPPSPLRPPPSPSPRAPPAPPTPKPREDLLQTAHEITPPRHPSELHQERRRRHFAAQRKQAQHEGQQQQQEEASRPTQPSREILGPPVMAPRDLPPPPPPPPPPLSIRNTHPPPTTPFEEFYQNFRAIKPGGVWARPRVVHGREEVDVLGWRF